MTVQIKAITSIDGNVCWCDEEDATAFAVYIGEPGEYRWLAIYYVVKDGGVLCADCANQELMRTIDPEDDQFYILAGDINYENNDLYCDHCNKKIESAYGEDDDK